MKRQEKDISKNAAKRKFIALIDTRSEIEGETLGTLISTHTTAAAAFEANDLFQQTTDKGTTSSPKSSLSKGLCAQEK